MNFETAKFLETLKGLNREKAYQTISLQQDMLMQFVSQPKTNSRQNKAFGNYKVEIDFLNKLGLEVGCEFVT